MTKSAAGGLSPAEAIAKLKACAKAKFDETVECCMHLGIDPRQADQQLRGALSMPKGIGKSARVICFCSKDKEEEMMAAGAMEVGGEELAQKITDGWFDFDVAIASPDMMKVVGGLGWFWAPRASCPPPKPAPLPRMPPPPSRNSRPARLNIAMTTVATSTASSGKMSFSEQDLLENLTFFLDTIEKIRPASVKGIYVKKCVITATMTPAVEVATS